MKKANGTGKDKLTINEGLFLLHSVIAFSLFRTPKKREKRK